VSLSLIASACGLTAATDLRSALQSITGGELAHDVEILASDEYEGRKPGTRGENLTVDYLERRLTDIGLAPGNPDGSYVQRVPLLAVTTSATASLTIGGRQVSLRTPEDFAARSLLKQDRVVINQSALVFAGYGIEAPEYEWDDFQGVDVAGKTVLVLLGEPSNHTPAGTPYFKGTEGTYYGTLRHKRETAARKGAAAIVFVIANRRAYEGATPNYRTEALDIDEPSRPLVPVDAAMPLDRLRETIASGGYDLDALVRRAQEPGFRALPLAATISFDLSLRYREFESRNMIAKLEGRDSRLKMEYVVFTAHWDALGRDPTRPGDQIRNGAIDDALGVAQMLQIAEAFQSMPRKPRRSILFLATTAEEAGLLGARYYARKPLYPLASTVANINLDNSFPFGRTSDVINFGAGRSDLDDLVGEAAAVQGRTVVPDPYPTEGLYFRMDHIEFAHVGIPAITPAMGMNVVGKPLGFGRARLEEYLQRDYHQVSDEVGSDWDYGGAVQDAQMDFLIALRAADAERRPQWKPGAEFKSRGAQPPASAPTTRNGSAPDATAGGSGVSGSSWDRSSSQAKNLRNGRRCCVTWSRMVPRSTG
jgi:hypothetical protein